MVFAYDKINEFEYIENTFSHIRRNSVSETIIFDFSRNELKAADLFLLLQNCLQAQGKKQDPGQGTDDDLEDVNQQDQNQGHVLQNRSMKMSNIKNTKVEVKMAHNSVEVQDINQFTMQMESKALKYEYFILTLLQELNKSQP